MARSTLRVSLVVALSVTALAACAPPAKKSGGSSADAATATSAADLGGMSGLVKAAKKEGALNVIALPPDWANYGNIIKAFQAKYGIKVNSAQPDAASQDEINAAKSLKGTDRAPDVFDLGQSVALANTDAVRAVQGGHLGRRRGRTSRTPNGAWINDYGGYMSIGYDSKKVPDVTGLDDLLKPGVQGQGRAQR